METPYITIILSTLFFTGFVKIATTLSIFRYGIGLQGSGFGVVILALSLALSFVSIELSLESPLDPSLKGVGGIEAIFATKNIVDAQAVFKPFLVKHADKDILAKFSKISNPTDKSKVSGSALSETPEVLAKDGSVADQSPAKPLTQYSFATLIAAFLTTELKEAFSLGLMILIPFLLIDLVVANILMVLSVTQIHNQVISLPLKILLFIAVDGWGLITEQLLSQYGR